MQARAERPAPVDRQTDGRLLPLDPGPLTLVTLPVTGTGQRSHRIRQGPLSALHLEKVRSVRVEKSASQDP